MLITIEIHGHYGTAWSIDTTPILPSDGPECGYDSARPDSDIEVRETFQFCVGGVG